MRIHFDLEQRTVNSTEENQQKKRFYWWWWWNRKERRAEVIRKHLFACIVQVYSLKIEMRSTHAAHLISHLLATNPKEYSWKFYFKLKTTQYFLLSLYFYHSFVCSFGSFTCVRARVRYFDRLSPVTNSNLIIRFQAVEMNCNLEMVQ